MPSFAIVFCRKSTLLCRQLVRRSMVFSTVQISMPGTSCAGAVVDISMQTATATGAAKAMRPIIKILPVNLLRARSGAGKITTLKPHSRVEVLRRAPQLTQGTGQGRKTQAGACASLFNVPIQGESLDGN